MNSKQQAINFIQSSKLNKISKENLINIIHFIKKDDNKLNDSCIIINDSCTIIEIKLENKILN